MGFEKFFENHELVLHAVCTVLQYAEGKECIVVGILYKHMKLKASIFDEYSKERSVPGAFTLTCSQRHLPGFVKKFGELKSKGVDTVARLMLVSLVRWNESNSNRPGKKTAKQN